MNYEDAVSKVYGRSAKTEKSAVKKPTPRYVKFGSAEGTYVAILAYTKTKNGKSVERREYLSSYFAGYVFTFFNNPQLLKPVTDRTNPLYEDTLLYDAKNKTFMVERYFHKFHDVNRMIVFVSKLDAPITPGTTKNLFSERTAWNPRREESRKYQVYKKINPEGQEVHEVQEDQEDQEEDYPDQSSSSAQMKDE